MPSVLKWNSLNARFGDIHGPSLLLNSDRIMPLHRSGEAGQGGLEPDSLDHCFVNFSRLEAFLGSSCSAIKSDKNPAEKNRLKIPGRALT